MKEVLSVVFLSSLFGVVGVANAAADAVPLPGKGELKVTDRTYVCGDKQIGVKYFDKGSNQLAIVPVEGEGELVFVRTVSASGAIYASGQYLWSGKIDWMDLKDTIQGKTLSCKVK
ncbi:MliC family protein [Pseudomonas chlororaphis]|uniref:C-type lysozyme inhibitor domain-containing protein n=1 Tax=Pseudomonas chlororaphis TaxID=587753 RepID=A0A1Q8EJ53_9PSED|nr:MliC family protein [Pseudomonas chlororaphis]OLF51821.1 hypothetical protein BTN82_24055 [Pseudomonas chlororaphis]